MNEQELREFEAKRKPSEHAGDPNLTCYGCAHSAAIMPYPSGPSGERPCCSCVRNPEREKWAEGDHVPDDVIVVDDRGNARCFNPFSGHAYNGAPYVHFPMDNYVTLDHRDQERFYEQHPDYGKPVRVRSNGKPKVVEK